MRDLSKHLTINKLNSEKKHYNIHWNIQWLNPNRSILTLKNEHCRLLQTSLKHITDENVRSRSNLNSVKLFRYRELEGSFSGPTVCVGLVRRFSSTKLRMFLCNTHPQLRFNDNMCRVCKLWRPMPLSFPFYWKKSS